MELLRVTPGCTPEFDYHFWDCIRLNLVVLIPYFRGFWIYWMFYDHFSASSLLAKLGRLIFVGYRSFHPSFLFCSIFGSHFCPCADYSYLNFDDYPPPPPLDDLTPPLCVIIIVNINKNEGGLVFWLHEISSWYFATWHGPHPCYIDGMKIWHENQWWKIRLLW